MTKIFLISGIIISVNFISCEEDFNPKTDFTEKYGMFAVIENVPPEYSPAINVVILKTFDTEGLDPAMNHKDNSITDCKVTILVNDKEIVLVPAGAWGSGTGFKPLHSYRGRFKARPDEDIKITAELPNGKVLTAQTTVPGILQHLAFSYPFNTGIHTNIDRFAWGNTWRIEWDSNNEDLYFPKLMLQYAKNTSEGRKYYSKEIPIKYVKKDNKFEPVYPSYTWDKTIEYSYDCIDSAMINISRGDSLKENYIIMNITFGITEFDRNLAAYYASTNGYLDNFSIRLDETVYSNISSKIGVFGASTITFQPFDVNKQYVESFGYSTY